MEIRFFEELLHDAGKAPEVCGGDNADRIIRESIHTVSDAVHDGHHFLPEGRRESGGNVFAISGSGKI